MALKQPSTLLDRAIFVLGDEIYQHVLVVSEIIGSGRNENINLELSIKKLAEFYDNTIPPNLHNAVTYHVLTNIAGNKLVFTGDYFYVFDLVLRRHVTKFSFWDWPKKMHSMFHMNLPKLKNLRILYLYLENVEEEHLSYVLQGIEGMKQLEIFRCNFCDDDILKVVCDNCPLKSLDFDSSEWFISDKSVPLILKLKNLKKLNILDTEISEEGEKQLLLGLSHLETLMSNNLNLALQEIENREFTSLQNVVYNFSNESDVYNLIRCCPSIKELQAPKVKALDLSELASLKDLKGLDVSCDIDSCNIHSCNISNILETRGYQITKLNITSLDVSLKALLMIDNSCPNLIKLSTTVSSVNDDETRIQRNSKYFQKLVYCSVRPDSSDTGTFYLIFFLRNCLEIKEILFTDSDICDNDLDEILCFNPLVNLQKFLFMGELTVQSIYKLLTSCKQLRYLGATFFWSFVKKSQLKDLNDYVMRNNINVEFIRTAVDSQLPSLMFAVG